MKSNRFFVFRGLVNLLDEIENYRWAEKNEQLKDEPVKEYDHAVDALRYAVMVIGKSNMKGVEILRGARIYG